MVSYDETIGRWRPESGPSGEVCVSAEYQREYLVRLPLPLAQLYGRAHNAKDPARGTTTRFTSSRP